MLVESQNYTIYYPKNWEDEKESKLLLVPDCISYLVVGDRFGLHIKGIVARALGASDKWLTLIQNASKNKDA